MNILTKICVVVLLITSLIACVVFVNMATNNANYKQKFEQEQLKAAQGENQKQSHMNTAAQARTALETKHTESANQKGVYLTKIDSLQAELEKSDRKNVELERKLTNLQVSLDGLSRASEAQTKTIDGLHTNLTAANKDAQKKHADAIRLETLLKKSQAKAQLLERDMSVLKQRAKRQKADYIAVSDKLATLEKRHGVVGTAMADPLVPADRVTGTITAITDNLASINIGSSSGLKKGMMLIIYRGADFVGRLKLESVDVNEAAGILMDGNPLSPLKGDKVTTKLD